MTRHEFGGTWTDEKLERVRKYLAAYTTIFAKNERARKLTTIYVDAFAGTGYRTPAPRNREQAPLFPELTEPDAKDFLKGSARIALEVKPPFKHYVFVDKNPVRIRELERLRADFPEKAANVEIVPADANGYLLNWCQKMIDWRLSRAVVFLGPYGMEVEWRVIEALALTKAVDLWILFPLGQAVNRLLTKSEMPPEYWAQALTRIFGTDGWKDAFYSRKTQLTLFEGERSVQVKQTDFGKISQFFVERLKSVFTAVAENPLPLFNSKNNPLFLLCFASGNPTGSAIAIRIAQHILRQ